MLPSPISGQIIARTTTLRQTVAADAELYRVANLSTVSLSVSLAASDAGQVRPGSVIEVTAPGQRAEARVTFVSPILDAQTRQVPVIARLDNGGGQWRVGESIKASSQLLGRTGSSTITVPQVAVQTIEDKSVVFVRTATGFRATRIMAVVQATPSICDRMCCHSRPRRSATDSAFRLRGSVDLGVRHPAFGSVGHRLP